MQVSLEPADDSNLERVTTLLEASNLPADDIDSDPVRLFRAHVDGKFVGVGGLEVYDSVALLRSIAIESSARGNGYGAALTRALENRARSLGVSDVYLLTTTAAGFFRELGYEAIDRADAPDAIRATTQFSSLCPDSAVCMRMRVE